MSEASEYDYAMDSPPQDNYPEKFILFPKIERKKMATKEKTMPEMIRIYFTWSQSNIDPIQYKPWSPTLLPESVKVAVDIPNDEKYIVSSEEGAVILTPCGMAYANKIMANAIAFEYRKE